MRLGMSAVIGLLAATSALAQPAGNDPLAHIGHVVVIFEENRSFDSMFGRYPPANGATQGHLCDGTTVQLTHLQDVAPGIALD